MLNVMLVDDEHNVRQGIKMMIPWAELGLQVICEGEDGEDGLKKILAHNPDIVVADVKMPGMSGIQMIEAAIKRGFAGKFIILSGYSDFTYAKEAISLGVQEFILKPVDEDELIKALKTAADKIYYERKSAVIVEKGSKYLNEQFIRDLLLGNSSAYSTDEAAKLNYSCYDTAVISLAEDTGSENRTMFADIVKEYFENYDNIDIVTIDFSGMIAVLFKGWKRETLLKALTNFNNYCKEKFFVAAGDTVCSIPDIKKSYESAYELYTNKFLYLHYGVVSKEIILNENENHNEIDDYSKQIFIFIEVNDIPKIEKALDMFQNALRQKEYTQEKIKIICITLVMDIKAKTSESLNDKKSEQFFNEEIISTISGMNSLFDIIQLLKSVFSEASNVLFGHTTKSTIERVVQYIKSNYRQELRLELLASIFGYNSAYLGKVFHQYTGENFNNYLDRIRITEAKRLLSMHEYKVYEVAEMVGYTNINYFHNKFKKYVGISPLSFKKQNCILYDNDENNVE